VPQVANHVVFAGIAGVAVVAGAVSLHRELLERQEAAERDKQQAEIRQEMAESLARAQARGEEEKDRQNNEWVGLSDSKWRVLLERLMRSARQLGDRASHSALHLPLLDTGSGADTADEILLGLALALGESECIHDVEAKLNAGGMVLPPGTAVSGLEERSVRSLVQLLNKEADAPIGLVGSPLRIP
jgi:hypothetical protein